MRVLITGGAGFIGSHLADRCLANGDEVLALDSGDGAKVKHLAGNPKFHWIRGTIGDVDLLEGLIAQADIVYHLAALVGVEYYVTDPYAVLDVTVNGTQNVLRLAFKHKTRVVFSSTSEVYGRNPAVPWAEDSDRVLGSTAIDRWCYSTAKACAEHFCFAYHRMGLPVVIVRYFNIYGPRLDRLDAGRVITLFLGRALRNDPLLVVGDGLQTRCFTYVSDAVEATFAAGTIGTAGEVYNIGTDVETHLGDLAAEVIKAAGSKSRIEYVSQSQVYGERYEDIRRRVPDVTKMNRELGVTAKVGLTEGLKRTIEWYHQ